MKNLVLLFVLLLSYETFSQTAYLDAKKLKSLGVNNVIPGTKIIQLQNSDSVFKIIKYYVPVADTISKAKIGKDFVNNPFIQFASIPNTGTPLSGTGNLIGSIGGLDVTNFADGVAKFLVKRLKEELTITFFENFQEEMEKSEELRTLFPETYKILMFAGKDIYQISAYINSLREAFVKDLTNLYVNVERFTKLDKYKKYFTDNPEIRTIIIEGLYLIDRFSRGIHPGKVLAEFPVADLKFKDAVLQQNVQSSVMIIQAFSESFKSKSKDHYWVPTDSIRDFMKDPISRNIYFGLMYQKYGEIEFKKDNVKGRKFKEILSDAKDVIDDYTVFAESLMEHAEEVDQYLAEIKEKKKKSEVDFNDYYKFYAASLDLLDQVPNFLDLPHVDLDDSKKNEIKQKMEKWLFVSRSAGNLYIDVRTKNYSSAIINAVNITDTMLVAYDKEDYIRQLRESCKTSQQKLNELIENDPTLKKSEEKINEVIKDFEKKKSFTKQSVIDAIYEEGITNTAAQSEIVEIVVIKYQILALEKQREFRENFIKYGSFAASVAAAKNSDEVQEAIEAIALPAGSSRIKRQTQFNISLNAYAGLFGGYEQIKDLDGGCWKLNTGGITAPIGISLSWGNKILPFPFCFIPLTVKGVSTTMFISLIDLGAVAAFRVKDDVTEQVPTIQLQDIVSPGIFYSIGLPKCPISLNFGVQMGPNLRGVNIQGDNSEEPHNDYSNNIYWRYSASIVVDIPIFNLYTKN